MIDFKQIITYIKASWIKRLLIQGITTFRNKWRYLALKMCGINDTETLQCKISPKEYKSILGVPVFIGKF